MKKNGSSSPSNGSADTASMLSNVVYESLKNDIISAELVPGTKLRVDFVCERYSMGTSPVREALTRLAGEGFVARADNRGFFVAEVSLEELNELTDTRCWLEEIALRRSLELGGQGWEEKLVVSLYRLSRVPRPAGGTPFRPTNEWVARHNEFHDALIGECRSRWLLEFCRHLRDQAYRYRRIASEERAGTSLEEHEQIMKAALARDHDLAVQLLTRHYRNTASITSRRQLADTEAENAPLRARERAKRRKA